MSDTQAIENILLVDPDDNEIGIIEKIRAHQYGMLHRAFSVLIFRQHNGKTQTLLQQRSKTKYHGGGLWTNACCSHPHPGEHIVLSGEKRLQEEMGISIKLTEIGQFHYIAILDKGMTENEIDHVLIGFYDKDELSVNPAEVDDYAWVDIESLQNDLLNYPQKYSPWLKQALAIALAGKHKIS